MKFNEKLKEYRKIFGLSQEKLAEKLNVSRQVITKWEADGGLPEISNLKSVAKYMNRDELPPNKAVAQASIREKANK